MGRVWRALGASWWIFGLHFWVLILGMLSKRALGGFWEGLGLDLGSILEGLGGILGRFGWVLGRFWDGLGDVLEDSGGKCNFLCILFILACFGMFLSSFA